MLNNLNKVNESLITESSEPKYKIYKYDVDEDREFSMNEMNIRSVPTIKIFKEGQEVFSRTGVMSPNDVLNLLKDQ
jgi:thioredoxin-like negative regulator of GroEL